MLFNGKIRGKNVKKLAEFIPADAEFIDEYEANDESMTEQESKTQEFLSAMRELGEDSEILVKRQTGSNKEPMEHVATFAPDEYTYSQLIEHLRSNYGGGLYRIYLRSGGRNKGNSLVRIATPVKKPVDNAENTTLKMVLERVEKMQDQMLKLAQENKTGGNSRMEMMQEMMMMKQLFDRPAVASGGVGEIVETINALKSLGLNIGGAAEPEEKGFTHLLEMAAPLFIPQSQPQQAPQVYKQNPLPNPEIEARKKMSSMIAVGLIPLVNAAKKNSDPGLYAEMVLDNVPEDKLKHFFNSPTGMADLIKIKPDIADHLAWFELLGEHVKALLGIPSKVDHLYFDEEDDSVSSSKPLATGEHDDLSADDNT